MNINKKVNKSSTGFWNELKKKAHESWDFFIDHKNDLIFSIRDAQPMTKLILGAVVVFGLIIGSISVMSSVNKINEKERILAELEQQIKEQQEVNLKIVDELNGNLDAYVEEQARQKLNMVYPDEQIFINLAG